MAAAIEGYASVTSAGPGDTVDFHVRAQAGREAFSLSIYRRGLNDTLVHSASGTAFTPGAQSDADLAVNGCDWPAVPDCRIAVPNGWKSGYYVAVATSGDATAEIPFVVRAPAGGSAPTLVKISDTTSQAYNSWGGRSLYSTPFSPRISFDRPYDSDLTLYEQYQLPFLRWAETSGRQFDYCSSLDLHQNPQQLAPYKTFLSIGHDEYWSLEERDQVEAFIAAGGNACFFSANTCFWQIRLDFSDGGRIMVCYKEAESGHPADPERDDAARVTTEWSAAPVSRPENSMTGVSYRNGAGWWVDPEDARRYRGYTVCNSSHWIFGGTGLADGSEFGAGTTVDDTILGYETDAALLDDSDPPAPLGTDGTPLDFIPLARADLTDWGPNGQGGWATMGTYRRNGAVFTAGTVNWAGGLAPGSPVERITRNVLDGFAVAPKRFALQNASFENWSGGASAGWTLDGAGTIAQSQTDADALANEMRFANGGPLAIEIDASAGETWIGQEGLTLNPGMAYGVGVWAQASTGGATIRLQTTDTWTDLASAEHSGSGDWEFLFATLVMEGGPSPARVKIQLAAGTTARFDNVMAIEFKPAPL